MGVRGSEGMELGRGADLAPNSPLTSAVPGPALSASLWPLLDLQTLGPYLGP